MNGISGNSNELQKDVGKRYDEYFNITHTISYARCTFDACNLRLSKNCSSILCQIELCLRNCFYFLQFSIFYKETLFGIVKVKVWIENWIKWGETCVYGWFIGIPYIFKRNPKLNSWKFLCVFSLEALNEIFPSANLLLCYNKFIYNTQLNRHRFLNCGTLSEGIQKNNGILSARFPKDSPLTLWVNTIEQNKWINLINWFLWIGILLSRPCVRECCWQQ